MLGKILGKIGGLLREFWTVIKDREGYGVLGLNLVIGIVALVVASWGFAELSDEVIEQEELVAFDQSLATFLHDHSSPAVVQAMRVLTHLGSGGFIVPATLILLGALAWHRRWYQVIEGTLTIAGGSLLIVLLKLAFQRQRPTFDNPIVELGTYSYPSGHTTIATLFFGFLVVLAVRSSWSKRAKLGTIYSALALIFIVALTRVYLGAHFLSDVLGGFLVGVTWIAFCVIGISYFQVRRRRKELRSEREADGAPSSA